MKRFLILIAATLLASANLVGQTKNFKLGQWTQIQNAIVKELNKNYVDSLPIDRIRRAGINAMLEAVDPYTIYIPEEEDEDLQMLIGKVYGGVGAIIYKPEKDGNVIINEPYEHSPAAKAGLVCGDEITAIDGVSTHGLETKECSDKMKGQPNTKVTLTVKKLRTGEEKDVVITRERIHLPDVEYYGMVNDTTGYILQTGFTEGVGNAVRNAVKDLKKMGMKRLVLDLRGNGGGLLGEAVNIVSIFVPKGSLVVTSKGNVPEATREYFTTMEPEDTALPLIVMVGSGTASSSEIVTGALQDYKRATVMGERTYGKGLVQSIRPLPYNGKMKITTAKYFTPSGRCVQALDYQKLDKAGNPTRIENGGISPDVEVKSKPVSRLTYSVVVYGIVEQYTLKYVREHADFPGVDEFHFTDYEDFVEFAKDKTFDYRSSAKATFDMMKKTLEEDGLAETMKPELDSLEARLNIEKVDFLNLKKDEIIPFIEEEIAVRYSYKKGGVRIRLRYDEQLKEALGK